MLDLVLCRRCRPRPARGKGHSTLGPVKPGADASPGECAGCWTTPRPRRGPMPAVLRTLRFSTPFAGWQWDTLYLWLARPPWQRNPMARGLILVKAAYDADADAGVWFVESSDLEGV